MNTRSKWILTLLALVALSLVVFTGAAFAQTDTPNDGAANPLVERQQWMEERMGEGSWAAMIQRMTDTHGAEFTGEMLQRMAAGEGCHGNGEHTPGSMMGRGVNGHGMMGGWSSR